MNAFVSFILGKTKIAKSSKTKKCIKTRKVYIYIYIYYAIYIYMQYIYIYCINSHPGSSTQECSM